MLSKNVNNKKCAPKLIFFNEKKIEKDSDNFWNRKLTLKVRRLGDFALFDTSPLIQFSKFNNFLWVCWFLRKNLSNFVPPVWKLHNPYYHIIHSLFMGVHCTVSMYLCICMVFFKIGLQSIDMYPESIGSRRIYLWAFCTRVWYIFGFKLSSV